MVKATNWDNKEEAVERMRELYPNMKDFLIDMCYDIYEQSKTDKNLEEEIHRVDIENLPKPKLSDYDGYDYSDANVAVDNDPPKLWCCVKCGVNENMIDGRKVAKEDGTEGIGGVSSRSEENPDYCKFCFDEMTNEKVKAQLTDLTEIKM